MEARHNTVLLGEAVEALALSTRDVAIDATLGGAGHFSKMLSGLGKEGVLVGIDADRAALTRAEAALAADARSEQPTTHLVCDNFRNLGAILDTLGIQHFDKALFDLGWSGFQLAAGRGFSYQADEPLLMTYGDADNATLYRSAAEIINSAPEAELADLIYAYGEERFARRIARAIVERRAKGRILTTRELVETIESATPEWYQFGKIHPATRTFQALRIAANDELGALHQALDTALARVAHDGRIAVITFHSIEDRIVKSAFRAAAYEGLGAELTKKPITPSAAEVAENRRARSAKLRVFVRGAALSLERAAQGAAPYTYA